MKDHSRSTIVKALKSLHGKPIDKDKTPWELFAHDEVYGAATSDRAVALVAGTILDQALESAILSHLIDLEKEDRSQLFGPNQDAPLSSFSARIRMGFALGVFGPKFRQDLDCIRLIRNAFAHTHEYIDFDTPEIADACNCLNLNPIVQASGQMTPKLKFQRTAISHSISLLGSNTRRPTIIRDEKVFPDAPTS